MLENSFSINRFYFDNKKKLAQNYPGLNLEKLTSTYNQFQQLGEAPTFYEFTKKVMASCPLEYIINQKFFYNALFYVDERVLIPRSETEILVEQALHFIKEKCYESVLDLGTGSGIIGLSIAMEAQKRVSIVLSDLMPEALEVARINFYRNKHRLAYDHVKFIESDRFHNIEQKFDLIITNPPYIHEEMDRSMVHNQVHDYEPHTALYLKDKQYFNWFEQLFEGVQKYLKENGMFLMEGHEIHLQALAQRLKKYNFKSIKIMKDYCGRDRFIKCQG